MGQTSDMLCPAVSVVAVAAADDDDNDPDCASLNPFDVSIEDKFRIVLLHRCKGSPNSRNSRI